MKAIVIGDSKYEILGDSFKIVDRRKVKIQGMKSVRKIMICALHPYNYSSEEFDINYPITNTTSKIYELR